MELIAKKRDPRMDSLKFILMFIVVVNHLLIDLSEHCHFFSKLILFNDFVANPLFVLTTGYFFKVNEPKKFWKNTFEIIILYLIFQTFSFFITNHTNYLNPISIYWFLICVIFWRIIFQYLPSSLHNHPWLIVILSLIVSMFSGFVPLGKELAFQRLFYYLPYYALGYALKKKNLIEKIYNAPKLASFFYVFAFFSVIYSIKFTIPLLEFTRPHISFYELASGIHIINLGGPDALSAKDLLNLSALDTHISDMALYANFTIGRFIMNLVTMPLAISLINLIPPINYLASEGKNTIFYCCYLQFLVGSIALLLKNDILPIELINAPMMVVFGAIIMLILYFLSKIRFLYWPVEPIKTIESLFNKKK